VRFDGNYRDETWSRSVESDDVVETRFFTFTVDDEQVTLSYELWADVLDQLGYSKDER
jgi:hypothetical protein